MCCPGREELVERLRKQLGPGVLILEVWDSAREGALTCSAKAFETGLAAFRDQPFTVLQDDAIVCRGFAAYADQFTVDVKARDLVIQWYAHGWVAGKTPHLDHVPGSFKRPHFDEFGGHDFVSSVATTYCTLWAMKIRDHLMDLIEHDGVRDDQGRLHGDDQAIADVLAWERKEFYVHIPSLVQHDWEAVSMVAGRNVAPQSHDARTSRCFVGVDFDAATLTGRIAAPWNESKGETDMAKHKYTKTVEEVAAPSPVDEEDGQQLAVDQAVEVPPPPVKTDKPAQPARARPDLEEGDDGFVRLPPPKVITNNCNECGEVGPCSHRPEGADSPGQPSKSSKE